mgnify:FL=1
MNTCKQSPCRAVLYHFKRVKSFFSEACSVIQQIPFRTRAEHCRDRSMCFPSSFVITWPSIVLSLTPNLWPVDEYFLHLSQLGLVSEVEPPYLRLPWQRFAIFIQGTLNVLWEMAFRTQTWNIGNSNVVLLKVCKCFDLWFINDTSLDFYLVRLLCLHCTW